MSGNKSGDPRRTRRYVVARARFLARVPLICHWCDCVVIVDAPRNHKRKATIDHRVEVDRAEHWAMDERLWVVACLSCNSRRGRWYQDTKDTPPPRPPSRRW